jgi:hypothetical protein
MNEVEQKFNEHTKTPGAQQRSQMWVCPMSCRGQLLAKSGYVIMHCDIRGRKSGYVMTYATYMVVAPMKNTQALRNNVDILMVKKLSSKELNTTLLQPYK